MKRLFIDPWIYIFLLLTIVLMLIWFRDGLMYGGGEEQIPFHHPDYISELTRYQWWDSLGLGEAKLEWFPSHPFFKVFSIIYDLTNSSVFVQAIFFGGVFLSAFIFVYLTAKELFSNKLIATCASLFYVFNPFVQATVFHRFIFSIIGLFGLMPLVFWLFIKGVKTKKIIYAIFIAISVLLFSIIFKFPGNIITLAIPPFLFLLFYSWQNRNDRKDLYYSLGYSLVVILIITGTNLWWILPFITSSSGFLDDVMTLEGFMGSLRGVSLENTLSYSLRIMSPHYFFDEPAWGEVYKHWTFLAMSWISVVVVLVGVVKGWSKNLWIRFFALIAIVGIFLAKGTNPPLGELVYWEMFKNIPFSRMFRNPHEKLGLLMPFGYSFLFAFGIKELQNAWKNKYSQKLSIVLTGILLCVVIIIFPWPMWFGRVINFSINDPAYVKVPDYYQAANHFFISDNTVYRILALPLVGHGVNNDWDYGYRGGELSRDVFRSPVFGRTIGTSEPLFFDEFGQSSDKKWFYEYLPLLSVKYILVREDINPKLSGAVDPTIIRSNLEVSNRLNFVNKFEKLYVYELKDEYRRPHIYPENKVIYVSNTDEMVDSLEKGNVGVFISHNNQSEIQSSLGKLPDVDFVKINPEKYEVNIKNAVDPFILVFSERFHPSWSAADSDTVFPHMMVNAYANGFLMDKKGNYDITIKFDSHAKSQTGLKYGIALILFAIVVGFAIRVFGIKKV